MPANSTDRYAPLSIGLHWLMLFVLAAVYCLREFRGIFERGTAERALMREWHYMLGLSVLALVVLRLVLRLATPTPRIEPPLSRVQALAATLVHGALYLFMLSMPVLGWLILSAEGDRIPFFGLSLPTLVAENKGLAEQFEDLHKLIANIGYFLVGIHAAAALFHHYVLRDSTLRRMLPRRGGADA